MPEPETGQADQVIQPETPQRDPSGEFVQALDEMLLPNEGGEIRFGANNEALRLSQVEALKAIRNCVAEGAKIGHVVQPGGTGKTREGIVAAHAMHRHGRNTLYVVPSQQAVQDFAQKARELCPDLDVGTVYQVEKRIGRLTFITYASLLRCILGESVEAEAHDFEEQQTEDISAMPSGNGRRVTVDPADYDLVIWDEAHKYLTANAQQLVRRFANAIGIALTATPRYYEGKEVAHVFGDRLHELDLATAVERKEINDFRNLLITTDVTTGLELSSPDQEESAEVARAIDIPNRNRIFPDLYQKAKIKVGEKDFTLTGEPTIVFGAGINHVHDLAQMFNDVLTPALQHDEEFRAALRAKGIDPDAVEQIAAPIHSDGTEDHAPMSLNARNRLVDRYHQRSVLVLVATSVLQQSFDSPMTSVVIDSVPRQTFVGVGQAGMRSLRYLGNKEMAFIINTQDADHPSLTFLDFQANRGREEGVSVEIAHTNGTGTRPARTTGATANYSVTYGSSLVDLSERRRAVNGQLYREDYETSLRHFTPLGFQRVNRLILDIAQGNQEAVGTFIEVIQPWIARISERIEPQVFGESTVDEETWDNAVIDTLAPLIVTVQSGGIPSWSRFSARFQQDLRRRCEVICEQNFATVSLDDEIPNPEALRVTDEPAEVSLHETIPSAQYPEGHQHVNTENAELGERFNEVLRSLNYREREILKLRFGLGDGYTYTLEEVAKIFKITRENIRQKEAKGLLKMRRPLRAARLQDFAPEQRPLDIVERQEWEKATAAQRRKNNEILFEIEEDLVTQKQVIFDILRGDCDYVPTMTVREKTGVSEKYTKPISDVEWTKINDLIAALDDRVLGQLKTYLPRLGVLPAKVREFDLAVTELKRLMTQFAEMGGKPITPFQRSHRY
jgi:RNA polymerase sigma factor (sigma-70 family)